MSCLRRSFWPFLPISCLLFLFFYHLHSTYEGVSVYLEDPLPADNILHPGDFVDSIRHPDLNIAPIRPSPQNEPDGEGTLHDVP